MHLTIEHAILLSPKWNGLIDAADDDESSSPSVEKINKKPPREKDGKPRGKRPDPKSRRGEW